MKLPRASRFSAALALTVLFVMPTADASQWYVDAASGSDANSGASPATAWKTITHAFAVLSPSASAETIHVAPGLYDPAHGESFPLDLRSDHQVIGSAGPTTTIVDGGGTNVFRILSDATTNPNGVSSATRLSGMTIRNGPLGVLVRADVSFCNPVLDDLVVEGCVNGVFVVVWTGAPTTASVSPRLDGVRIEGNTGGGLVIQDMSNLPGPTAGAVRLADCTIQDSGVLGVDVKAAGRSLSLEIERSRIVDSGGVGIDFRMLPGQAATPITLVLRDSLVAAHQIGGLRFDSLSPLSSSAISGCTFADNREYGIRHSGTGGLQVASTIAWDNGSDVQIPSSSSVRFCDFGNGNFAGQQGTIQADPLFVDPANRDYRLRFGSPCIESGDPASIGTADLSGTLRPLDGDLDTLPAPDMGAFEFETLHRFGTPSLGQPIGFEFWGASGSSSTLFLAKLPLTAVQVTPFGDLYLDPLQTLQLGVVPAEPGPPFALLRTVPQNPSLVGTTFSFQGLTTSALAPQGSAYTNPISFVVLP